MSASEANRSFSSLLRQVAQGETFTVLSRGRPIATISPAQPNEGAQQAARESLFARLHHQPASGVVSTWRRDELYDQDPLEMRAALDTNLLVYAEGFGHGERVEAS